MSPDMREYYLFGAPLLGALVLLILAVFLFDRAKERGEPVYRAGGWAVLAGLLAGTAHVGYSYFPLLDTDAGFWPLQGLMDVPPTALLYAVAVSIPVWSVAVILLSLTGRKPARDPRKQAGQISGTTLSIAILALVLSIAGALHLFLPRLHQQPYDSLAAEEGVLGNSGWSYEILRGYRVTPGRFDDLAIVIRRTDPHSAFSFELTLGWGGKIPVSIMRFDREDPGTIVERRSESLPFRYGIYLLEEGVLTEIDRLNPPQEPLELLKARTTGWNRIVMDRYLQESLSDL